MSGLIEREALLAQLADARREGGRLILVGGEAGVGKTSLVRAFTTELNGRVLHGACERFVTPVPLGPLIDVAYQVGGALAADVEAGRHPRHVAQSLLDELDDRAAVLVVEDVHWADEATFEVLRVLGRRIALTPSLVIATYRDDEAVGDHPLRRLLGELASVAGVERLEVPPLSPEAVRALASASGSNGDAVHALTRGNPFFVTELLASGGAELPATVRDAVLARVAGLSDRARQLLDGVALVAGHAELWLLETAFEAVADRVDECVAAGALVPCPGPLGDAVAFRHELARLAVESTVAPWRRRALHAAILEGLEGARAYRVDSSRLAHHAVEAGNTAAVLTHGRCAAERGSQTGAHREAAAQYARVLRYAGGLALADRADLLRAPPPRRAPTRPSARAGRRRRRHPRAGARPRTDCGS